MNQNVLKSLAQISKFNKLSVFILNMEDCYISNDDAHIIAGILSNFDVLT